MMCTSPTSVSTSAVWQDVLALDVHFSRVRPCMQDAVPNRNIYLRRRSQLTKEHMLSSSVPNTNLPPNRLLYQKLREQLLSALYSHTPSLNLSISHTFSVDRLSDGTRQGSPYDISTNGSFQGKCWDASSHRSSDGRISSTIESFNQPAYAFSGIDHIFDHHFGAVNRLRFANQDNSRLAIGSADGRVSICTFPPSNLDNYTVSVLKSNESCAPVTDVVWSLSNDSLISTYEDGSVSLWNTVTGELVRHYPPDAMDVGPALVCAYQPQNFNLLIVGGAWSTVQTINLSTGKPVKNGRDQLHSTGLKLRKIRASFNGCQGQGCITALAFDAGTGASLWVGTDRGVIQSYTTFPSTGQLSRTHRVNVASLYHSNTSVPIPTNLESSIETKSIPSSAPSLKNKLSKTSLSALRRKLVKPYMDFTVTAKSILSVTSLSVNSWLSREANDTHILANVAGMGLILFQVTSATGRINLKRIFPIPHQKYELVTHPYVMQIHSCFAPLPSLPHGACGVTAAEDGNVYLFDVLTKSDQDGVQWSPHPTSSSISGLLNVLQGHTAPVLDVAITWDESVLASGDERGAVIIWRRNSSVERHPGD